MRTIVALSLVSALMMGCSRTPMAPVRASATRTPLEALAGTNWLAGDLRAGSAPEDPTPTLQFISLTQIAGSGGCNRFTGPALTGGHSLRLGPLTPTSLTCPEAVMTNEKRFFDALDAARTARIEGGQLMLLDGSGRRILRLSPAE